MTRTTSFLLAGWVVAGWVVPAALVTPLAAQNTGGQGAGNTGSSASGGAGTTGGSTMGLPTGGRIPGQSSPSTSQNPQGSMDSIQRPVFLSGKVMMDDGSPVPSDVVIQRVCGGVARSVAYTDTKGRFSFQWGQNNGNPMEASDAGGFGVRSTAAGMPGGMQSAGGVGSRTSDPFGSSQFMNCELRADLGGYRSSTISLFNRNGLDTPEVGTLVLHRLGNVEGTSISATSFMAPKDAKKAYDHGLQSLLRNKPADAEKDFEKAVAVYPKYADAWVNLGKLRFRNNLIESGTDAFQKALDADSKLVSPYIELGMQAAHDQKWEAAAGYLDRGLRLDPIDFPQAWYADAAANFNLKKYDQAEKSARETVKLDPQHANPRAQYLLGLILAEKHDYAGAAEQFRAFTRLSPNAPDIGTVQDQLGQIEKFLADTREASAEAPAEKRP